MDARKNTQLINVAASSYNVGLVLMAHLGWRLWRHVGREEFPAFHRAWWFGAGGLQPILWPGVLVHALGSIAQLGSRSRPAPAWMAWAVLGLQAGSGALTGAWWGRQQAHMEHVRREDGSLDPHYEWLITTHWLRVVLITAAAAGQVAIAARVLTADGTPATQPVIEPVPATTVAP